MISRNNGSQSLTTVSGSGGRNSQIVGDSGLSSFLIKLKKGLSSLLHHQESLFIFIISILYFHSLSMTCQSPRFETELATPLLSIFEPWFSFFFICELESNPTDGSVRANVSDNFPLNKKIRNEGSGRLRFL